MTCTHAPHSWFRMRWQELLDEADANDKFSSFEGGLPAYYSFVEELEHIFEYAYQENVGIDWEQIVPCAMESATPAHWELVSMVDYDHEEVVHNP